MKKMKQCSAFLIILGACIIPTSAFADLNDISFTDTSIHWAKKYIDYLADNKIVTGANNTNFEPDRNITRAEFSVMLSKAMELNTSVTTNTYYQDVKPTDWYAGYVNAVAPLTLFIVYDNGSFHPDMEMTREELAIIIVRALDARGISSHVDKSMQAELLSKFTDRDLLLLGKEEIADVLNAKIMNGTDEKTFAPLKKVTRAEASAVVARFLSLIN